MQIKDLGEFKVIDLLQSITAQRSTVPIYGDTPYQLIVDNGDDAAAWKTNGGTELFTTDTMVEGVHFDLATRNWTAIGWKSLASNISDIAAMGGKPKYALITLGLPPETEVSHLEDLYLGYSKISNLYGVRIVGGDMVRANSIFITVGLVGIHPGQPMVRTKAKPGDMIGTTGYLGSSGAGLKLLEESNTVSQDIRDFLLDQHKHPYPAVETGVFLSEHGVQVAMDISDGLADDLSKLTRASQVAARIYTDQISVHPFVKQAFPDYWLELALHGGEDYQLLFSANPQLMANIQSELPSSSSIIGEIVDGEPGQVTLVGPNGELLSTSTSGWDHYR